MQWFKGELPKLPLASQYREENKRKKEILRERER